MNGQETDRPQVSLEVAQHVLHHFGDTNLGLEPGGFWTLMFRAWDHADAGNRERARLGWPEEATAFFAVKLEFWGLEWLRSKVKRGLVPDREHAPVDLFEAAAQSSSSHECAPFGGGDECLGCLQDEDAERMRSDNAVQS